MTSPFRDEVETLRRENERLRAQLAGRGGARPLVGVGLAIGVVGAAVFLRPWLNGGDDGHFWGALAILGALTFGACWGAVGYKRRG